MRGVERGRHNETQVGALGPGEMVLDLSTSYDIAMDSLEDILSKEHASFMQVCISFLSQKRNICWGMGMYFWIEKSMAVGASPH